MIDIRRILCPCGKTFNLTEDIKTEEPSQNAPYGTIEMVNIYTCPVCSQKFAEGIKQELKVEDYLT
jgi:hypothetical protein